MPTASSKRSILFIVPLAERNGATTSLLHFLRWFKAHGGRPFATLLAQDGELVGDLADLAEAWPADRSQWRPGSVRSRILRRARLGPLARRAEKADVRKFADRYSPALIYVNSVTSAGARLVELLGLRVPVLMHVHELDWFLYRQAGSAVAAVLSQAERFIACSNAVSGNLIRGHGIPPERIETVHESIPVAQVRATRTRAEILEELELPQDSLLVAGSGNLYWGKGADLFVQLAQAICRQLSNTYLVWIGRSTPEQVVQFRHDVDLAGVAPKIRLTGAVAQPADYLAAADVFVLTSREDSFPLVCLEAAALGKPIVCFAGAGGMPEFVEQDCGFVVPYLDVNSMADRIVRLLDSAELRLGMGAAARRKVTDRHDISVAGPRIMDIIERTAAEA